MMQPYYEDDAVTIYHGRCEDVVPSLGPVDLVFTSPPYNLGTTTGGGFPGKKLGHYADDARLGTARGGMGKWSGGALVDGYGVHDDAMPHDEYVAWQKDVLRMLWAKLAGAGAIYYNHKVRVLDGIAVTPLEYNPDLPVRQIVTWARAGGINFSPVFYCPTSEWVVIFAKPDFARGQPVAPGTLPGEAAGACDPNDIGASHP